MTYSFIFHFSQQVKQLKLVIIISFIYFSGSIQAHTYYEGFSDIRVNIVKQRIEIVHHFTTHDLEILLSEKFNKRVSADRPNYPEFLKQYINNVFKLSRNNKPFKIRWSGIENGVSETVIYQTVEKVTSLNNVKVTNRVLIDFYPEQINRSNYEDASEPNKLLSGTLIFNRNNESKIISKNIHQ